VDKSLLLQVYFLPQYGPFFFISFIHFFKKIASSYQLQVTSVNPVSNPLLPITLQKPDFNKRNRNIQHVIL